MKIKKVLLPAIATVCLSAGMWAQTVIPAYVPTNSLVGWWPFNGNANDLSINANNGTVNGATLTADRFGNANKAYSFDGNDWIDIPSSNQNNLPNSLTLSTWIQTNTIQINSGVIGKWNDGVVAGQEQYVLQLDNNYGGLHFWTKTSIQTASKENNNEYSNGIWHLYVGTWDGLNMKLYRDGNLIQTSAQVGSINNFTQNFEIGRYAGGQSTSNYFKGSIDEIGIWSRALTACEIKKLYYSPSFTLAASNASICVGQSLTLSAGGVPNYSWSNGANTATTVVTPTASTVYTVSSTYTTGCADTKTIAVTVNACTGISELNKENTISIYPNPAKESITITSTNALAGKFYVIHDATGKQVAKGILSPEKTSVSLTGLSAGLYILSVEGNLNQTYKFVKE